MVEENEESGSVYLADDHRIVFRGSISEFRLAEYTRLIENLVSVPHEKSDCFVIDLSSMHTINGTGMMILSLFLISLRDMGYKIKITAGAGTEWLEAIAEDLKSISSDIEVEFQAFH